MAMLPVEITMRDIPNSEAIEGRIRQKVEKLSQFYRQIEFCKVVVELSDKHKHQGRLFATNIEIGVPGKRLVVNHKVDEDLYVVLRDAFAAMRRQIDHYAHRQRGEVKQHVEPLMGRVVRLFSDYGFIEDFEGREFYFNATHMTPTLDDFNTLLVGDMVSFLDNGVGDTLQASHVNLYKPEMAH